MTCPAGHGSLSASSGGAGRRQLRPRSRPRRAAPPAPPRPATKQAGRPAAPEQATSRCSTRTTAPQLPGRLALAEGFQDRLDRLVILELEQRQRLPRMPGREPLRHRDVDGARNHHLPGHEVDQPFELVLAQLRGFLAQQAIERRHERLEKPRHRVALDLDQVGMWGGAGCGNLARSDSRRRPRLERHLPKTFEVGRRWARPPLARSDAFRPAGARPARQPARGAARRRPSARRRAAPAGANASRRACCGGRR